jgi:hypothetical protein
LKSSSAISLELRDDLTGIFATPGLRERDRFGKRNEREIRRPFLKSMDAKTARRYHVN